MEPSTSSPSESSPTEQSDLIKRVTDLEEQVRTLKTSQESKAQSGGRLESCARFLIANWVLLSFLAGIVTAVYVKYTFHVDPFESYRNISDTKKLANFYERMGDRMMAASEWQAAEEAYRAALQLNPNNTAATFGVAKATVFQPLPGQKYTAPEVTDARLDYLLARFPDDYQMYFLKGIRYHQMGDDKEAESWFRKCIDKAPNFTGCYVQLAFIEWGQSDLSEAAKNLSKAVQIDPNSATAKNNLAACLMLQSDFLGAAQQFEDSFRISPLVAIGINLGEAYWYLGKFSAALNVQQWVSDYMDKTSDPTDREIAGEWNPAFLPLFVGDRKTTKENVHVYRFEDKKAIAHFELAIDQALLKNLPEADRELKTAEQLGNSSGLRALIQNRMQSVANIVQMPGESKTWLEEHSKTLE